MTRKDWLCPKCGNEMSKISDRYITCLCGNTRLFNTWSIDDLPRAMRVWEGTTRDYFIQGCGDDWRYVPHRHKTALDKAPPEGCVVASVAFRGGRAVRLFRRKGTLGGDITESFREYFSKLGAEEARK